MTRIAIVRPSSRAAFAAGLLYIGTTALDLFLPQATVFARPTDYVIEALFVGALACTLEAYSVIHRLHRGHASRLERIGFWLTMIGTSGFAIAALATLFAGGDVLGPLFLGGVLLAFVGNLGFGTAVLRAHILPAWCAIALMVALPVSVLLEALGGGLLLGLLWLALGLGLTRPAPPALVGTVSPSA